MDWWTYLIQWTHRHAWCDTDLVFSLKYSPEQYINTSFLYIFLHSDHNDDNDGDDDDSDDDGDDDDDDSDGTDDGVNNVHGSENGDFSDRNVVWQK